MPTSSCDQDLLTSAIPDNPWEGYHIDHYTNCLLPPYDQTGRFDYVNSGVYLHDVEDDGAPMLVIPGSHKVAGPAFVRALDHDNAAGGSFKDLRQATELAAPVPATGRQGSALFYSSYLVHAAQPFAK